MLFRSLLDALDAALADPAVQAVVLTGGESVFSVGADVKEFGTPKSGQSPNLPDVIRALERSPKPVVAAIAGHALGGVTGKSAAADNKAGEKAGA